MNAPTFEQLASPWGVSGWLSAAPEPRSFGHCFHPLLGSHGRTLRRVERMTHSLCPRSNLCSRTSPTPSKVWERRGAAGESWRRPSVVTVPIFLTLNRNAGERRPHPYPAPAAGNPPLEEGGTRIAVVTTVPVGPNGNFTLKQDPGCVLPSLQRAAAGLRRL